MKILKKHKMKIILKIFFPVFLVSILLLSCDDDDENKWEYTNKQTISDLTGNILYEYFIVENNIVSYTENDVIELINFSDEAWIAKDDDGTSRSRLVSVDIQDSGDTKTKHSRFKSHRSRVPASIVYSNDSCFFDIYTTYKKVK